VLEKHVRTIPAIFEEALKGSTRPVLDALYTELRALFRRIGGALSLEERRPALSADRLLESSMQMLAEGLLFRNLDPSVESLRSKRAQAADEYITVARRARFGVRETARQWIETWLAQERVERIQHILRGSLGKLDEMTS
jgi:proteasome component ECM29